MRIAIITGASSGMGRECVKEIVKKFKMLDEIWVVARRMDRLEELEQEVKRPLKKISLDLATEYAITELNQLLESENPDIKILVNAAGFGKIGDIGTLTLEEELGMVRLNCETLCAITHIVLPYMKNQSMLLQFASSAGFVAQPGFTIYAATKAFVVSYSRGLHEEVKERGIRVTAVCPGRVKTEFFHVAEQHNHLPIYKKVVEADPKAVIKQALFECQMGRSLSIYHPLMYLFYLTCKIFPHSGIFFLSKVIGRI